MKLLTSVIKKYFKNMNINIPDDIYIKSVEMDSRKITDGALFFAINSGKNYIDEVISKGASLVICDEDVKKNDEKIIKVKNTVKTLQEIAKEYRNALGIKVISVTGSEGKTTTKDIIHGVLSEKYITKKTLGNYNNHIGLPFTILQLQENDEVVVLEMGMSDLGEIDKLSMIAKPDYAVITNIGDSHLQYLKNRDNVFKAKTEVLNYVREENVLVYGDDYYLKKLNGIKIGFEKENEYIISGMDIIENGVNFKLNSEEYFIPLNGKYNIINSSFAIVIGKIFNMKYDEIVIALKKIKISSMRFEKIEKDGYIYINDAYNASPVSMENALEAFSEIQFNKKKIVVLGDMLELGENEIDYHILVLKKALTLSFDRIFIYGELMKKALLNIQDSRIKHFETILEIQDEIEKIESGAILLKGSRGMKLERVIR